MNINILVGQTLTKVVREANEEIRFSTLEGNEYVMLHHQDCCEGVSIDKVEGNLNSLIGSPVTQATESAEQTVDKNDDRETTTIYNLTTEKASVKITWIGSSNGYYDEGVDFDQLKD